MLRLATLLVMIAAAGAWSPWPQDPQIRVAAAITLGTLVLWISEVAPLGVIALGIPVAANFTGLLSWSEALQAWGHPIVFLFLGTFLLARALEKFAAFDALIPRRWLSGGDRASTRHTLAILTASGAISTVQNNTAVTAALLGPVLALARRASKPAPLLLGLAYGATFGGMATPVGTAPNAIGYNAQRQLDPDANFLSWAMVGIPVWIGTTLIGWAVLSGASRRRADRRPATADALPDRPASVPAAVPDLQPRSAIAEMDPRTTNRGRVWAIAGIMITAAIWLTTSAIRSALPSDDPRSVWIEAHLPESLAPIAIAILLFLMPIGGGRRVLERADLAAIDWDTLFLIAGGICLGALMESSGFARAVADSVVQLALPPFWMMLTLSAVTVLLSELTSNTATASLLVPLAQQLAPAAGLDGSATVLLVALSASLGFALPVSTPPNAIVFGTRLVPLRFMVGCGVLVDCASVVWITLCVQMLA